MSTIGEFFGEFLVSPIPMELGLNYCSHKCAYCFANLNQPGRTADAKALMSQLRNYHKQNNLTAHLLREKYPVLISNRVDPFAVSNYQLTLPVVETLTGLDVPVAFQTRGGKGIDEALQILKGRKTLWYISICQTDDAIRKRVEPGGSPLHARWELIERLQAEGHNVVVGVNPLVPEWVDLDALFNNLIEHNIKNVWIGRLHLNNKQRGGMSERELVAMGSDVMKRAAKKGLTGIDLAIHNEFMNIAAGYGIEVYHTGMSTPSRYFDIYHETYPGKTFPVMQDFINYIWQTKNDGDLVRFSEWRKFILPKLPKGDWALRGYITSHYDIFKETKLPGKFSFGNVLDMFWNHVDMKKNLSVLPNFAHVIRSYYDEAEGKNLFDYVYDAKDQTSLPVRFSHTPYDNSEVEL